MKFNQREIFDLKFIISNIGIPMSFKFDGDDIDLDFTNDLSIQSIIKKKENGFSIVYTNSSGIYSSFETQDWGQFKYRITNWLKNIKRDNPYEIERKINIQNLSENFYLIFQEATIISELGFKESAGMIFRKALEILIKDFFRNHLPSQFENIILEKTIGQIIYTFYERKEDELHPKNNVEFRDIAKELQETRLLAKIVNNTFKIGNDFSHYERRLAEFTSLDMKNNLLIIVDFIDNQIEKEKLIKNESKFNESFKNDNFIK